MTDEWDPTAYHNHRNMSFGASTLAHRIHTVPTKTMFGRYDEFQGNLQDAGATECYYHAIQTKDSITSLTGDNGSGLPNPSKLISPDGSMKGETDIGQFYSGGFTSIMSSDADVATVFSCARKGKRLIRSVWECRPKEMKQFVSDKVKAGEPMSDINTELMNEYHPYVDQNDARSTKHISGYLDDLRTQYGDVPIVQALIQKKHTGTVILLRYEKETSPHTFRAMKEYVSNSFKNDIYKLKMSFTSDIAYHCFIDQTDLLKEDPHFETLGYFQGDTFQFPVLIHRNPNESIVIAQGRDYFYETNFRAKLKVRKRVRITPETRLSYEEKGYTHQVILKHSIVDHVHEKRIRSLYEMEWKNIRVPVIETAKKIHGIGNNVKLQSNLMKRGSGSFLAQEQGVIQSSIFISDALKTQFGITAQKDRIELETPCASTHTILQMILRSNLWCNALFGTKDKVKYDIIKRTYMNLGDKKGCCDKNGADWKFFEDTFEFILSSSNRNGPGREASNYYSYIEKERNHDRLRLATASKPKVEASKPSQNCLAKSISIAKRSTVCDESHYVPPAIRSGFTQHKKKTVIPVIRKLADIPPGSLTERQKKFIHELVDTFVAHSTSNGVCKQSLIQTATPQLILKWYIQYHTRKGTNDTVIGSTIIEHYIDLFQ